jgi:uncharacterized protein (DUF2141 family)
MKILSILIVAFLSSSFSLLNNQHNVKVEITGIRSTQGKIRIGVYISSKRFEEKKDSKIIQIEKLKLVNNKLFYTFYLEPGTYGLSLLDDENDNTKMDYNFIGLPKEGFGFSNYYHSGFTYPKFENFAFTVKPMGETNVVIKLRYI